MATRKSSRKAAESLAAFNKLKRQPRQLTDVQVAEFERAASDPPTHMWRRGALATLAMSGKEILAKIEPDRESAVVFAALAFETRAYIERQLALLGVLETACLRIELLSCAREDWDDVREEAKTYNDTAPEVAHV
jgi:hypothetical protein